LDDVMPDLSNVMHGAARRCTRWALVVKKYIHFP